MLDRIYLDNNETSSYPLLYPSDTYPQGLISDVSILVDDDISNVSVYSVVSIRAYVLTVFVGYRDGSRITIGHSTWDRSGMAVSAIISDTDDSVIGWISYGSIANNEGQYIGEAAICPGCIVRKESSSTFWTINGVSYEAPEVVNIVAAGDLGYGDKITVVVDNFLEALDADNPDINCSINSVNGYTVTDEDTIVIQLPVGQYDEITEVSNSSPDPAVDSNSTDTSSSSPVTDYMLKVKLFDTSSEGHIITINDDPCSKVSNASALLEPFTCPNSDILLSSISVDRYDVSYHETPLDAFIKWYRINIAGGQNNEQ